MPLETDVRVCGVAESKSASVVEATRTGQAGSACVKNCDNA